MSNFIINNKMRDSVKSDIIKLYKNNNIENNIEFISKMEKYSFNKYKDSKNYFLLLAKLSIFFDSSHFIGQFSKFFREKLLQNVYSPEKIIDLNIVDLIPEIFLNPKTSIKEKEQISNDLNLLINDTVDILFSRGEITPKKINKIQISKIKKKIIADKQINVKKLCDNPHWKIKSSNIIICKDSKKFYCLDLEKLINELATKNTATNYFTKKKLSEEISNNLKKRYSYEINEIKNGNIIEINKRTELELSDLKDTVLKLVEFKKFFNNPNILEIVNLFGLSSLEDDYDNIIENIPPMIRDKFDQDLLNNKDFTVIVSNFNKWLDDSIIEINNIIEKKPEPEPVIIKENIDNSKKISKEELIIIKDYLLVKNTLINHIYNGYNERLINLKDILLSQENYDIEFFKKINLELLNLESKTTSIRGLISILQEEIKIKTIEKDSTRNSNIAYSKDSDKSIEEQKDLNQLIIDLNNEIEYLNNIQTELNLLE